MTVRILLVDDHQLVRQGLRSLLEDESEFEVVGESGGGSEALEKVAALRPDVVVMDVAMKGLTGIEATRRIKAVWPGVAIVALSGHEQRTYVRAMLESGAAAYVVKANAYEDLLRAVRAVCRGNRFLSPEVAGFVIDDGLTGDSDSPSADVLAPREREILRLIAEGMRSAEIAAQCGISLHTVETHRRNIMRKLDLHSVADVTRYAIRQGLTSAES